MADAADLNSAGHIGRVGSTPIRPTVYAGGRLFSSEKSRSFFVPLL